METTHNTNTTKFIIEVRRTDTQRRAKFFQSSPNEAYFRIRTVSTPATAKQFKTRAEADTMVAELANVYCLRFTVAEMVG